MAKLKKRNTQNIQSALQARRPVSDIPVELPDAYDGIERNDYYLSVSRRFRLARLSTLAVFLLYVLLMLTTHSEDLTVANLQYLMRDINLSSEGGEAFSGVSYSAEPIQRFAVYRGDGAFG